jgi:hypothetical protein
MSPQPFPKPWPFAYVLNGDTQSRRRDTQSRDGSHSPATGLATYSLRRTVEDRLDKHCHSSTGRLPPEGVWPWGRPMLRSLFVSAMFVAAIAPAHARRVEMISFAQPEPAAGIQDVSPSRVAGVVPFAMDSMLASNFAAIAGGVPAPAPGSLPTDGMSIPLWLQTGVSASSPSSVVGIRGVPPADLHGCGDTTYRVRADLPSSTQARRAKLFPLVAQVACEAGIPVGLFDALIVQESRYQMGALSPKGAAGLAQLMPGTARELGVTNSWDPLENLRGGALYLRRQLNEFGRVDLALAAYNAGPGRVRARRRVPAIAETMNYVATITRAWSGAARVATVAPFQPTQPLMRLGVSSVRQVELASYGTTHAE